ncbi:glycosyltransferase family 4 protein, partial [bacterium]|nr:glycosyltransferase family 4 protein [bacterium]
QDFIYLKLSGSAFWVLYTDSILLSTKDVYTNNVLVGMKITILSLIFPPETGSARRVGELVDSFAEKGHDVTVITGFPSYPEGKIYHGYNKTLLKKEKFENGVTLIRVWLYTTTQRYKMFKRLLHYISFTVSCLLGSMYSEKPDIIYVVSHPYFLGFSAKLIKILRGGKIVLDVQDSWPEAPIALGYVPWKWLAKFLEYTEKMVYSIADLVLTLSPEMSQHLIKRGASSEKIEVVYNWVDHSQYAPLNTSDLRKKINLVNSFLLVYAGNIGKPQGLDVVLNAAEITRKNKIIKYIIVGDGAEKNKLQKKANNKKLDNVVFLPRVSESEVVEYLSMADALLVHLNRAPHRFGTVPSKLQVYMASGRPILLGAIGAPFRLIKEAECGLCFEPDDAMDLSVAIKKLMGLSISERESMGKSGRLYAMQNFDMENQCSRTEKLISELGDLKCC